MTKPTQADMDLALKVWTCFPDNPIGEEMADGREKAAQLIAEHIQKAVNAETQRMCDVAYAVYDEPHDWGRYGKSPDWFDGAYAVVETLGKEVK